MFTSLYSNYYIITIVLQAICAIHCIRKGTQQKWIWIIVFLPVVGCIAYLYTEVFSSKTSYQIYSNEKSNFLFGNNIKKLEETLRFSDTFKNRTALADAYSNKNQIDKAIVIYEDSLQGNFKDNEYVSTQPIYCYFKINEFQKLIDVAKTIYNKPQFLRSQSHTYYAVALAKMGNNDLAENEFKMLNGKFSHFEARYHYALFLKQLCRFDEANNIFKNIIADTEHMNFSEKRSVNHWVSLTKKELNKV